MRIDEKRRTLTKIVQDERGKRNEEPGAADRYLAEVPHVGIERLAASHGEYDRTERDERRPGFVREQGKSVPGIKRSQDDRRADDPTDAEDRENEKPDHHHGAEQASDACSTAALHDEKPDQDRQRQRYDERFERMTDDAETFNRTQHRNRRRQHPVAVEQGKSQDGTEADQHLDAPPKSRRAVRESGKGQDAAFAVVVGAHDEDDVFQRHDDEESPQDQR